MKRLTFALAIAAVFLSFNAVQAQFKNASKGVQTFDVADKTGRNQAVFHSSAPLEDITGTATGMMGTVSFNPDNVAKTIKAEISVDVNTLKTGIDMRDEHMRGDGWLNAKQNPRMSFVLKSVKNLKMKGDNAMSFTAVGNMTINGITQPWEGDVSMTYLKESEQTKKRAPGDLLAIRAKGKVQISKFGIKQPEVVGSKLNEIVDIEFNAVASNAVK